MTVRANKPAFNIREKLKELERPIGLKGSELMKSETAQDARDLVSAGRKNIIYNGSALINQRGANGSISSGTTNIATDRWLFEVNSAGTWDLYQAADGPPGFGFCHKIDCTAANASLSSGSVIIFQQRLEGLDLQQLAKGTASAKNLTLSFYVKSSKIGKYIVEFQDANNGRICQRSYNINSANVWEYKTITIPGDTSGVLTNSNGHSFTVRFWLAAGSLFQSGTLQTKWGSTVNADRVVGQVNLADSNTAEWNVTGVQLEVGKNATDFEHRSYGEELTLCQRYYEKFVADDGNGGYATFMKASKPSNTLLIGEPVFRVLKRAPGATLTFGGSMRISNVEEGETQVTLTGVQNYQIGTHGGYLVLTISNNTHGNGDAFRLEGRGDTSAYMAFSSEL